MKKLAIAGMTILAVLAATIGPAAAAHDRGGLTVGLNGANEVGVDGDKDGSGKIRIEFFDAVDNPAVVFPGEHYLCYELTFRKIDAPTMAHIHEVAGTTKNPRKDAGGVVVNLFAKDTHGADATRPGPDGSTCVAVDEETFDGIFEDPSEYYVNLHNAAHPGGAIRGQLHNFN